ncbi:MAG: hypothetical protein PGN13_06000, partial [Patulibacter minatonensis]
VRASLIPFVPRLPGLAGQVLHAADMAELYRLAVRRDDAHGAYNAATDPPLDADALGHLLNARPVALPPGPTRSLVRATWKARLHPVSPGWLDIARGVPVMATDRARTELGWTPQYPSHAVMRELLDGLQHADGFPTPPLDPHARRADAPARAPHRRRWSRRHKTAARPPDREPAAVVRCATSPTRSERTP